MHKSLFLAVLAVATAVLLAAPSPASAGVIIDWNFSFVLDNGDTGSGTFVTQDSPAGGPYLITSIVNGFLSGNPMSLLAPGPAPSDTFNDNLLYTTQPLLDGQGLGFTEGGVQWGIWSQGGAVVDNWCNNSITGTDHLCTFPPDPNGSVLSFSVQQVGIPEPATLAMLATGLLGIGVTRRRRRHPLMP